MVVPEDPREQVCGGIIDAARTASGQTGGEIMSVMGDLGKLILDKQVLGEEMIIDKGAVTIKSSL
jgi:hypothetical protein